MPSIPMTLQNAVGYSMPTVAYGSATDWSFATAVAGLANSTAAVTVAAAPAAGISNYITSLQISTGALVAPTELVIRNGAGGSVLWRIILNATTLPLLTVQFVSPLKSSAATLLEFATLTAVLGGVYVNMQGYTA